MARAQEVTAKYALNHEGAASSALHLPPLAARSSSFFFSSQGARGRC